jgi:hypothetical protein
MFVAFTPLQILFCTDGCSCVLFMRVEVIQNSNLIWIQMGLQIMKRFQK